MEFQTDKDSLESPNLETGDQPCPSYKAQTRLSAVFEATTVSWSEWEQMTGAAAVAGEILVTQQHVELGH
jgi:hypothetical protein